MIANALAVYFWQSRQWHTPMNSGAEFDVANRATNAAAIQFGHLLLPPISARWVRLKNALSRFTEYFQEYGDTRQYECAARVCIAIV